MSLLPVGITKIKEKANFGTDVIFPLKSKVSPKISSQQKEQNEKKPLARTEVVTKSMRSYLFTSFDEHCYFMFIGCDGFNHMLAVYRHNAGISAWRWIVQTREKEENLSSLFKHIPEQKMPFMEERR